MRRIRRKIKKFLINLILLFTVLSISFIFFELSLKFFYPQELNYAKLDTELGVGYTLRKNFHGKYSINNECEFELHTNSKGLREEIDYTYDKSKDITRILFLGDSHTFGYAVEANESYTKQLLKKLKLEYFTNIEIINAAIPSYSTYKEMMYLKNEAYKYNLDMVVVGFYVGNDFSGDAFDKENIALVNKILIAKRPFKKYLSLRLREYASSHLHSFIFIRNILRGNKFLKNFFIMVGVLNKGNAFSIYQLENKNIFEDKNSTKDMERTVEILDEIKNFTFDNNIKLIFLILPQREQVNPAYFNEYWTIYSEKVNIERPQTYLTNFCEEKNILYIDALPILRRLDKNNTFYLETDNHMNSKGYALIADLLYENLINQKLITKD